ncbi:MAG TPA: HAD-IIB family hydrolase [Verrucomicrobiae bacterium]|nr:HAD-IIB family hydrolase [Verrucomicrobiae bacterium]
MSISYESLVLACDIDDTLVPIHDRPGEEREAGLVALSALVSSVETMRSDFGSVYFGSVTGRSLASHQEYEAQVPVFGSAARAMDFKVTSVGSESYIRTPDGFRRVASWPAAASWESYQVRRVLSDVPGLIVQPDIAQGDYKVSFTVDEQAGQEHAATVARVGACLAGSGLAANVILSSVYLDILPLGVDKGTGLYHTLGEMALQRPFIIAAGDSMNDVQLLEAADLAILPRNAHPRLRDWAERTIHPQKLFLATLPFAAGIHEGLERLLNT